MGGDGCSGQYVKLLSDDGRFLRLLYRILITPTIYPGQGKAGEGRPGLVEMRSTLKMAARACPTAA